MLTVPQTARNLQVHIIEEVDAATMVTSLQAWLNDRTEEVVVGLEIDTDGGNYIAFILYTE